jgi:hypothetical protein
MGMSEKEFRLTTPRYFYFRQKGFEALQVEYWQRTRMEAFYSFLPHTKKGALRKPEDMFRLPGENTLPEYNELQLAAIKRHMEAAQGVDIFAGETIKFEA